jgi:hypothetical protein
MKHLEHTVETSLQYVQYPDLLLKYLDATLVTYKRRQMKHLRRASKTLATYVYNHCNICNFPIYFCNIRMKQLKHTYETTKTLETWRRRTPMVGEGAAAGQGSSNGCVVWCGAGREGIRIERGMSVAEVSGGRHLFVQAS